MSKRLWVLTGYFLQEVLFSLAGSLYIISTLAFWAIFFPPGQATPDMSYYVLVIGAYGAIMAFLVTLTIAARANRAVHYAFVSRLPSRVEYLVAVLLSTLLFVGLLQLLLGGLALIGGPSMTMRRVLDIIPAWAAPNILATVLALHASDFVTAGWSRVYIYGVLAILLIGRNISGTAEWFGQRVASLSATAFANNWIGIGSRLSSLSNWLNSQGSETVERIMGLVFWPLRAQVEAIQGGGFSATQALAPAALVLYATILFLLAAELFATKDLALTE